MSDSQGLVGCFFLSGTEKKYWTVFTCHNLAPLIMSLYCSQSTLWSDKRLLGKYLILDERTFTTAHHATDVIDTDLLGIFPLTGKMYQEETLSVSYHSVLWQQCEFCKVFHWRQGLAVQQPTMRSVLHKMRKRYHFPMNLEKCIAWVAISFISINELDMNFTLCNRSLFNTLFFFFSFKQMQFARSHGIFQRYLNYHLSEHFSPILAKTTSSPLTLGTAAEKTPLGCLLKSIYHSVCFCNSGLSGGNSVSQSWFKQPDRHYHGNVSGQVLPRLVSSFSFTSSWTSATINLPDWNPVLLQTSSQQVLLYCCSANTSKLQMTNLSHFNTCPLHGQTGFRFNDWTCVYSLCFVISQFSIYLFVKITSA